VARVGDLTEAVTNSTTARSGLGPEFIGVAARITGEAQGHSGVRRIRATGSRGRATPTQGVPQVRFPCVSRWIYTISFPTMPATSDGDVGAEVVQSALIFLSFIRQSLPSSPRRSC
jgi:hypothetical protein